MKHDADDAIARLLRDRVEPGPAAGPCLDADVVAAWFDGTLSAVQQRDAESHAATCARCQSLLAVMAQTEPVAAPPRRSLKLVRWFAPALVAAAAVVVWFNVAGRRADVPQVPSSVVPSVDAPPTAVPEKSEARPDTVSRRAPAAPSSERLEKRAGQASAKQSARDEKEPARKALDTNADALSRPAVPKNEPEAGAAAAATVPKTSNEEARLKDKADGLLQRQRNGLIASPAVSPIVHAADGSLWRVAADGTVGRSVDNGTTWSEHQLGSPARILAGSSPSPNVVWFAGADGVVVMTIDGASWRWRSLSEHVDVTGIAATDGQTATVTTRDGRHFVTRDGGITWVQAPVQENHAAPFLRQRAHSGALAWGPPRRAP